MRKHIDTGDVLLTSSNTILSEAIQDFTNCKWSHAGLFLWINEVLYICEAQKYGIQLTKFDDYLKSDKSLLIMKPFVQLNESKMIDFCLPFCGATPYDFFSLLIAQPIYQKTGRWIGRKNRKAIKRFTCSEWVAYVYSQFTSVTHFTTWYKTAPSDLFKNHDLNPVLMKNKSSNKLINVNS